MDNLKPVSRMTLGQYDECPTPDRQQLLRRGKHLEYFTIAYNSLEAVVSILAGLTAGSVSLISFGLDSLIEVTSGSALLWRLRHDTHSSRRERSEHIALRIVGACFLALACYVLSESAGALLRHEPPRRSILGITIAFASVIFMPLLARAKRQVAAGLGSDAMNADSRQADFCTFLSAILLAGLLLNAALGWWWADPVAALMMVPIIAREGASALKGQPCSCDCACGQTSGRR
ncbi:MAG TPA: cation transporter [Bryobacteraceae bacterium]|nr:cation transporter [Bryobacteraceae bacterium]